MRFGQDDRSWVVELLGGNDLPRRVVGVSRVSATGRAATRKATTAQSAESKLEHDFLILLDHDNRVRRFASNPFTLPWVSTTGKVRKYTPDVLVQYTDEALARNPRLRNTVFEVKPLRIVRSRNVELKTKWRAAVALCGEFDLQFKVVSERQIRTPFLQNVSFLRRFRPEYNPIDAQTGRLLTATLGELGPCTVSELLAAAAKPSEHPELIPPIWGMVYDGIVQADLQQPLTMGSKLWIQSRREAVQHP